MRNSTILVAALALLSVCSLGSPQAFSEDLESYVAGSQIHDQGGWKGWDNAVSAGAIVSDKFAYSGKNSVEILGTSDLVHEFTADRPERSPVLPCSAAGLLPPLLWMPSSMPPQT